VLIEVGEIMFDGSLDLLRRLTTYARLNLQRRGRAKSSARVDENGYTLVEILVVLAIISLVMGLVGPRVMSYLSDSKAKTARLQIDGFTAALDLYYLDNGVYPSSTEGLQSLVQKPDSATNWNGPYLKINSVPKDPWGRPYNYSAPGQHGPYDITSLGMDGRDGGEGVSRDIVSWER
jgi:general secretion pathway protein G